MVDGDRIVLVAGPESCRDFSVDLAHNSMEITVEAHDDFHGVSLQQAGS